MHLLDFRLFQALQQPVFLEINPLTCLFQDFSTLLEYTLERKPPTQLLDD